MKCAYDEMYLSDVQKSLGFFFQFLLHNMRLSADEAQSAFLGSVIPEQIEIANPDFLCGKSGDCFSAKGFVRKNQRSGRRAVLSRGRILVRICACLLPMEKQHAVQKDSFCLSAGKPTFKLSPFA